MKLWGMVMEKKSDMLTRNPLFGGLTENQSDAVKKIAVDRYFSKGEVIFSDGDEGTGFFIIVDGRVKVFKLSSEGKEQILHILYSGESLGVVPVFSGRSFPANAQAISKTHLLFFSRSEFVRLISEHPSMALNMIAFLSIRLREFTVQIENLSLKEVPARLASYLLYMAKEQNNAQAVTLNISKGQLASLIGTVPETLSRIFSRLSSEKLIEIDGRKITLLDRSGLDALAAYEKKIR